MSLPKCPPETDVQFGWRYWTLLVGGWLLSPISRGSDPSWPGLKPMTARCTKVHATSGRTPPPAAVCQCGIYATAVPAEPRGVLVWGRVALWGKVLDCGDNGGVRGWRAQYAYPYELFVRFPRFGAASQEAALAQTRERVRLLRDNYRVDVSLDPSIEEGP